MPHDDTGTRAGAPKSRLTTPGIAAPTNRRQLATRARAWPASFARALARAGFSPNQVSVSSVLFAAAAGLAFWRAGAALGGTAWPWLAIGAAGIQLRLLCNLLDGLMAIEGGLKTPTGELYNEIPDRIADVVILLGAGVVFAGAAEQRTLAGMMSPLSGARVPATYPFGVWLGVAAAILAVLTAYVRLLGGSLGQRQDFRGPMAKQHRMFALTVGALGGAIEHALRGTAWVLYAALALIVVGSVATFWRRTVGIARGLRAR